MDVGDWLRSLGLGQYESLFRQNDIDAEVLNELTEGDLEKFGVSFGHRKRLLKAIASLGSTETAVKPAAPAALQTSTDAAERRQLTVMFCDLVGSTALSARLDPEDMRHIIRAYQDAVSGVVARYDGFVAKFMGDGILAYFGFPRAHEDDAARAVHAGLEIAEVVAGLQIRAREKLAVRVGIATGLVVVGDIVGHGSAQEQAVVGDTPNLAARLQGLADAGGVVVSAMTRRLIGDRFRSRNLGRHAVKGLAEPVEAWAALGVSQSESRFEAAHAARLTNFVGREAESADLLERQRQAWAGHGQIVLISGEAGIGKSRLSAWLAEQVAGQPHTRLRYQCSPYHRDSALYPFAQQFERAAGIAPQEAPEIKLDKLEKVLGLVSDRMGEVAPLIASLLSIPLGDRYPSLGLLPAQQHRQTISALLDQMEGLAQKQPVLALFEDAHWADATSLEVLDLALERVRRLPFLFLITYRPEFEPPWKGLPDISTIALQRLDHAQAEMLVEGVTGGRKLPTEVMAQIVAKTDGVPLFVEELTKNVLESGLLIEDADRFRLDGPLPPLAIPSTLQDSLMGRLDRLATVKEIAQIGAAIGREFSYPLLHAVVGRDEAMLRAALAHLEESELVFRSGDPPNARYTFKHALVQDTAYENLLKSRRQILHRRIAEVLREQFSDVAEAEPELLAHHFTRAGLSEPAIEYWIAAGDIAERHGANQEAAAHYRSAKQLLEKADLPTGNSARAPEVLMKLGNAQMQTVGYHSEEVLQSYQQARDAALALDQQDEAAEAGIRMSPFLFGSCRLHDIMEIGDNILKGDPDRLRPQTLVHLWVMMGSAHCHIGEFRQSLAFSEKAIVLDDEVNCTHKAPYGAADPAIVGRDNIEMASRMMGHFSRSLAVSEQSMAIALNRGHQFSVVWASVSRVFALRGFGRYTEAVACADHAIEICEKFGFESRIGNVLLHRGPVLFDLGEEDRGLADIQRGVALWRKTSGIFLLARSMAMLAEYQLRANQLEQARTSLGEAESLVETTEEKDQLAEIMRLRGRVWQREGNHEQAKLCFERAIARSRDQQARLFELHAARDLAKLSAETGDSPDALENLRSVVDWFPASLDIPVLAECRALLR